MYEIYTKFQAMNHNVNAHTAGRAQDASRASVVQAWTFRSRTRAGER